ncbi:putative manganese transporter [Pelagovum pacificum]|uniref:Manganese transporter n=1 Tax=Pelagovum pacificum TaxID=2588711 RepID=A0A5C5GHE6_9RHOB|nr:putative manganese transporter [Pelagovum pacificum]QQA43336.1 arsenic efflux protein [Pelagovum pacificum]TNY33527.1 hypothetical protein FHY64_09705 [Pelagovum pacificum]
MSNLIDAFSTSDTASGRFGPFRWRRLAVAALLLGAAAVPGQFGEVTRGLMMDAYVGVAVFVAATLMLFYGAERLFNFDLGEGLRNAKGWQVPLASLLGATPGCGGAVVVVAAYSSGNVRFGAVVATLTATMGDAAFLLLATRPEVAAVVLPISFVVGIISGWLIDAWGPKHLEAVPQPSCELVPRIGDIRPRDMLYIALAIPGLALGIAGLAQIEPADYVGETLPLVLSLAGIATGLFIWSTSSVDAMTNSGDAPVTRTAEETSFITVWVLGAFALYEYATVFAGLDLASWFSAIGPILPLIGIAIGFVPGCGPQVLVTTLYINGLVPFAALIGNAISNDGDALFPAIALNPKAAFWATFYSAIPAVIVAYGFHVFAPGFMN